MDKKEAFKSFARNHPELVNSIKSGNTSWQKLYEIYDIYGEDNRAWDNYFNNNISTNNFNNISNIVKNIDMESVQKHINTAQKALGLVEELTGKGSSVTPIAKGPSTPRPINKFFED
ncbi:MAG: YlbD family protein [Ruminococcus sp.]|nr:YlbD family protein [Ruminococcus sp.]